VVEVGQVLIGASFSEPMRVVTVRPEGNGSWTLGLVGKQSERYVAATLTQQDLASLTVLSPSPSYAGDGQLLRLGLQAYQLGVAYEFDPYFGLSISRVDPLPHQLEAVYDYLLKLARVRFLLADDAGAGKTVMAGLLIRELKLRGLAQRILVVVPANLAFQWQRELRDKFEEKFIVIKGADLREQFGINQWQEYGQVITSLDLAKRDDVLPGLRQCTWDLVIVDEAHRLSAASADKKSLRYKLGEDLSNRSDHFVMLTATPHKGDPVNFTLFLQLLDRDVYADVRSINEAMNRRKAPFYLRRTKEAMVYFPERQPDGTWGARPIFTKRIPNTADFSIDGDEFDLYRDVTTFVKAQSRAASDMGDDARARAVGFLMALYQRRLASSTYALRHSLENRARRLRESLKRAQELARQAPPDLPTPDELEEMEDYERERLEDVLAAVTLSQNPKIVQDEIERLDGLARRAMAVEASNCEAKLVRLKAILAGQDTQFFHGEDFLSHPERRLLIFTEFRDTLDYLVLKLRDWGFAVECIHGSMKPGSRDEPGTRLYAEQRFRDGPLQGGAQVLVATEAAGEGINLQCCNILFNYDIPWNPNRLEQRMGRIHRYGQTKDCYIFNCVATNTIEGQVLNKLLEKLREIRDALDDDAVFNVVGEVLPAAQIERVLRDYYSGKLGDADLEDRLLRNVKEDGFRNICQNALEGLATKKLNLAMLVERRARAQEHRLVPETIARFLKEAAPLASFTVKEVKTLAHTFDPGPTPVSLRELETRPDWKLPKLTNRYPRLSTDRQVAEQQSLEWVTPGHPLFEALRRHTVTASTQAMQNGACFYWLDGANPIRLDFYRARVVDGLGNIIHERLFVVQVEQGCEPVLREPGVLGNMVPAKTPSPLPAIATADEVTGWLHEHALRPFLDEVRSDRLAEVERVRAHVDFSLTELIAREDEKIGKLAELAARGVEGAAGNLKQAEDRHAELLARRQRRREELARESTLTLQSVERLTSALVLPHPEPEAAQVRRLRPDAETEATAMRVAMDCERAAGRAVADVHEKDLGYDLTSLDTNSGELRLIEVKGIGAPDGTVILTPNEHRVAQDRRDCYWLYVVTNCDAEPRLAPIKDPTSQSWQPVQKVQHYTLSTSAIGKTQA
jgi:superfamily II DNA or RNA helicase